MSIRIDNDRLNGSTAAQAGRTEQAQTATTKSSYSTTAGTNRSDSVEMSSIAESLLASGARQDQVRAARISQLASAYAAGSYQPDSMNISRAIVEQAIQMPPENLSE